MELNKEQSEKALLSIVVTPFGISMDPKFVHCLKAETPIIFNDDGNDINSKAEQYENAPSFNFSSEDDWIFTVFKFLQVSNAYLPIIFIVDGRTISVIPEHDLNEYEFISSIPSGIERDVIFEQ